MDGKYRLVVTVKEIRGKCPVFKVGDRIVVDVPEIAPKEADALCIHALGSMLPMIVALSKGVSFKELGLAKEDGESWLGPVFRSRTSIHTWWHCHLLDITTSNVTTFAQTLLWTTSNSVRHNW